jgi:hypothetical protein
MISEWEKCALGDALLVAYGGNVGCFQDIAHPHKTLVGGDRLRTRDHQREKQSYADVYSAVADWLRGRDFSHIHVVEFDHVPLVPDLNARQLERMARDKADVMGFGIRRVDGTSYANYLYHAADPRFHAHWKEITRRREPEVALRMFGTGCLWTREAFDAVAARPEPFPIYLELYLPTLAHHLGFRVRDWGEQNRFVHHLGDFTDEIERARQEGAWTLHPVKRLWTARANAASRPTG